MSSVSPVDTNLGWPRGRLQTNHRSHWGNDRNFWRLESTNTEADLLYITAYDNQTGVVSRGVEGWPGEPSIEIGASWYVRNAAGAGNSFSGFWCEDIQAFVYCGFVSGGGIYFSRDGLEWTRTNPVVSSAQCITWSRELNLFVVVGQSGSLANSTSVGNFTLQTSNYTGGTLRSVTWSAEVGLFVAIGDSLTSFVTSPDGFNWTQRTTAATLGSPVKWISELQLFIAPYQQVATSPDGVNWTNKGPVQTTIIYREAAWSPTENLLILASAQETTTGDLDLLWSRDGINFTPYTFSALEMGDPAVVGPRVMTLTWLSKINLFMAVVNGIYTAGQTALYTSPDGFNWTMRPFRGRNHVAIMWSPTLNLLIVTTNTGTGPRVYTSGTL